MQRSGIRGIRLPHIFLPDSIPFHPGYARGLPLRVEKVKGYEHTYRVRAGDYRIVYEVAGDEVAIIAVSHRKGVYRELK